MLVRLARRESRGVRLPEVVLSRSDHRAQATRVLPRGSSIDEGLSGEVEMIGGSDERRA